VSASCCDSPCRPALRSACQRAVSAVSQSSLTQPLPHTHKQDILLHVHNDGEPISGATVRRRACSRESLALARSDDDQQIPPQRTASSCAYADNETWRRRSQRNRWITICAAGRACARAQIPRGFFRNGNDEPDHVFECAHREHKNSTFTGTSL